jgi:hypothetical protein
MQYVVLVLFATLFVSKNLNKVMSATKKGTERGLAHLIVKLNNNIGKSLCTKKFEKYKNMIGRTIHKS